MVYFSTEQLGTIPIPARLKCWQCNKWKRSQLFSNKQHKEYKVCILQSRNTSGLRIRCFTCCNDSRVEMKCQGPCGKVKDLQQFSKNSRKAGGNQWCIECTGWKLDYEPDDQIGPAPEPMFASDESYGSSVDTASLYGEDDSAYGDGGSTSSAGYETGNKNPWYKKTNQKFQVPAGFDNASEVTDQMGGLRLENEHPYQPPHLRGIDYKGPLNRPTSPDTRSGSNTLSFLTNSVTTASNPYESEPDDEWRPIGPRSRHQNPIAFNGYDKAGNRHSQLRYPSMQTSLRYESDSGSASADTQTFPPAKSGKPTFQYGPEGDGNPDSDDDNYYD